MSDQVLAAFDGYMILNATQNSDHISIGHASRCAIHVVVDNVDAYGEVVIQASNNRTNWVDVYWKDENGVTQDGYDVTTGNDLNHIFDADTAAGWLRVRYERVSGSGGLWFYVNTKK